MSWVECSACQYCEYKLFLKSHLTTINTSQTRFFCKQVCSAETCYRDQLTINTDLLIIPLLKFEISFIWYNTVAILQMEKLYMSIIYISKFKSLYVVFWIVLMLYHWHVLKCKSCLKCQGYNCSMPPAARCWLPSYFLKQCPAAYQQVFIINES